MQNKENGAAMPSVGADSVDYGELSEFDRHHFRRLGDCLSARQSVWATEQIQQFEFKVKRI